MERELRIGTRSGAPHGVFDLDSEMGSASLTQCGHPKMVASLRSVILRGDRAVFDIDTVLVTACCCRRLYWWKVDKDVAMCQVLRI